MENQLDQLKQELVQEIKDLATEISKSNSFVGLLSQEIKFKSLHEKFINLKFLERKHIGLDVFDQPIPMHDTKEDIYSTSKEDFDDDESQELNFERKELDETSSAEKKKVSNDFNENVMQFSEERIREIEDGIEPEDFESTTQENIETTQNEIFEYKHSSKTDESKEQVTKSFDEEIEAYSVDFAEFLPKSSALPKIQVDFNDRIAFLHQLFEGDNETMDLVFNTLNHLESVSDSNSYLKDLIQEMNWVNKEEYIGRLQELIHKRFD